MVEVPAYEEHQYSGVGLLRVAPERQACLLESLLPAGLALLSDELAAVDAQQPAPGILMFLICRHFYHPIRTAKYAQSVFPGQLARAGLGAAQAAVPRGR